MEDPQGKSHLILVHQVGHHQLQRIEFPTITGVCLTRIIHVGVSRIFSGWQSANRFTFLLFLPVLHGHKIVAIPPTSHLHTVNI